MNVFLLLRKFGRQMTLKSQGAFSASKQKEREKVCPPKKRLLLLSTHSGCSQAKALHFQRFNFKLEKLFNIFGFLSIFHLELKIFRQLDAQEICNLLSKKLCNPFRLFPRITSAFEVRIQVSRNYSLSLSQCQIFTRTSKSIACFEQPDKLQFIIEQKRCLRYSDCFKSKRSVFKG